MSANSTHASEGAIPNPGKFETPGGLKTLFLAFAAIGIASFSYAVTSQPDRAWASFVLNHFFFMSLAVGGLFFASLQWLTGAMWSAPVRRLSESFTAYLPFVVVSSLILYFGLHHLYDWTHVDKVRSDVVLSGKSGYLSVGFFMARSLVILGIFLLFSKIFVGNSIAQDANGDYSYTRRNRALSPVFMIVFGLGFTIMSFDLLMSLDPHWFSTMFGVYCFAGLFYSTLAATCVLTLYLRSKGMLEGILNDNHLHDLGKFMFAFTVFWAYIGFSQFLLIWYANLPEETEYYIHRFHSGWACVSIFLLIGKFVTPFFLLLPRDAKRNTKMLAFVGVFMLVAQWIDVMWMVQPQFFAEGPRFGWVEIGTTLGFLGIFCTLCFRFLARNNVVAIGDPRLAEAIHHHHQ